MSERKRHKLLLRKAFNYANDAHKGQVRMGRFPIPYINHCCNVAQNIMRYTFDLPDEHMVVMLQAAYLHDVAEDTSKTLDDIEEVFGFDVAKIVMRLTKPEVPGYNLLEEFPRFELDAMIVKLADRLDNISLIFPNKWYESGKAKEYIEESLRMASIASEIHECFPLSIILKRSAWDHDLV